MPLFRDRVSKKPFIVGFDRDGSVLRATRRLLLSPPNRNKASRHKPFITRHKITSFSLLTTEKTLGDYFSPVMFFSHVFFGYCLECCRLPFCGWRLTGPVKKLCGSLVAGIPDTHIADYEQTIWLFSRCCDFADKPVWRHINDFCRFADNTVCA